MMNGRVFFSTSFSAQVSELPNLFSYDRLATDTEQDAIRASQVSSRNKTKEVTQLLCLFGGNVFRFSVTGDA